MNQIIKKLLSSVVVVLSALITQQTLAQFPPVDVTKGPLFAAATRVNPNLVLSLSVEFPTVGAAYRTNTYDNTVKYTGYWDNNACYSYVVASNYFSRAAETTNNQCSGQYSGNMLNWAAHSAIDMLRYALTGGDRITDSSSQTILQRAVIPTSFYNNATYFPSKKLDNASLYTPFTGTIYIANCLDDIFFGSQATGTCAAPGNNSTLGSLKARVEVCTAAEADTQSTGKPLRLDGLCTKYPAGNYKPTGSMQEYSDRMKFSAFGYLNESGNQRYGGVLRAPMKYVGSVAFNNLLNQISNPNPEWDANTGVFSANPLNDALGQSGVVNYLNKFGRTGTPGAYKSNDPVSELYYEVIRYLQGQQPTPEAISSPSNAGLDGFPIYTSWTDPISQSCQKNFIIQIADAYTHQDKSIPGNTRTNPTNGSFDWVRPVLSGEPNVVQWTNVVGSLEANTSVSPPSQPAPAFAIAAGGNQYPNNSLNGLGTLPGGCCDASHYIAGLAYWANTQPFRSITIPNSPSPDPSTIRAKTFVINVDENGNGTVTNRERLQQLYLAAKYGGFDDINKDGNPFKTIDSQGNPVTNNSEWAEGVDDNGQPKPKNFFLASNPERMIAAIRSIFTKIASDSGTISGASVSSSKIEASGSSIYVPRFKSARWSGTVLSYQIIFDVPNNKISISPTPTWDADYLLTGDPAKSISPVIAPAARKIYSATTAGVGIPFQYASLDGTQQTYLNRDYYTSIVDGLGSDRVNFLRGVRSKEQAYGGTFRNRDSVMGDIINSAPVFVGAKPATGVSGTGYTAFYDNLSRPAAVYVGTNAGMLHSFNADTGQELFAFVPPLIMSKVGATASPGYVHMPMIDSVPIIREAQIGSNWKSILVSGVGGGAQGVFALDVTRPDTFDQSNYLWQFTDADDKDMGFLMTSPKIYKFKTGANTYKWYAAVASGYDNYTNDGSNKFSANGAGALFLLDLEKGSSSPWQRDVNYYKIILPVGGTITDATIGNALSTPSAVFGSQGEVKYLYAGDTQGNMWKFDFASSSAPWSETNAITFNSTPFFTAKDSLNNRQPITIEPIIGLVQGGQYQVLFGTGKFIENSDLVPSSYITQTMYGLRDTNANNVASKISGRSQLKPRVASTPDANGEITITGSEITYGTGAGTQRGWYFDFTNSGSSGGTTGTGERQVTNMLLSGGNLFFNTLKPNADVCSNTGGGNSCSVNARTGLNDKGTCTPSTVGLLASPILLNFGEGLTTSTASGRNITSTRSIVYSPGTNAGNSGGSTKEIDKTNTVTRRLMWREIVDFSEQKNK
jgi:type IV pilus assembly protein PilY1